LPESLGDGAWVTEGDTDADGEWLGLGLDGSGVGTGGIGHRQLGAATGPAGAGTADGRRAGDALGAAGDVWAAAGAGDRVAPGVAGPVTAGADEAFEESRVSRPPATAK
jgi:hypothetical protein